MPYPNQSPQSYQYQYQYQPQFPAPMDRLAQIQAQQYNIPTQISGAYQQPPQQTNQGILWTRGEEGANNWWLDKDQSVLLMDSEAPVFYIKSTDNSGMPYPLRIFDYKERERNIPQETPQAPQEPQTNLDDKYATRQEYDELQGKYNELQGKYMEILNRLDNFSVSSMVPKDGKQPPATINKARNRGGNDHE